MERWKKIDDTKYEVSDKGNVRNSRTGKILKPAIKKHGYAEITICEHNKKHSVLVHKLVAETFLGNIPDGMEINHKDENKLNNAVENLEYCTHRDNINHGSGNLRRSVSNRNQKRSKETCDNISKSKSRAIRMIDKNTGDTLRVFSSSIEAMNFLNVSNNSNICRACMGKRKTAFGYKWGYAPS